MAVERELPTVESLVPCREIFERANTNEFLLLAPLNPQHLPAFPWVFQFSLYLKLVDGRGSYHLGLAIQDDADEEIWSWKVPAPVVFDHPLQSRHIALNDLELTLPRPGRYLLVLQIEGKLAAQSSLWFRLQNSH